jgi:hypothetical protein
MPSDKWGIPFIYPTKLKAGNTTSGAGFFWEQNNNIKTDSANGMVRLGKEFDDVSVINSTTGEWEFPYLADGDGLDMSGPTGHHSGGETHGCEGFTYMFDSDFTVNPPRFRFRKETYHVQYNDHPDGYFTSPLATGPVINNWKGMGWVRYNKKDGISPGKDSVICEGWWNDNPTADITNWVMLKRVEDKGAGITNWGVPATCDGDAYQVGTWSNIQFRFKSSSSDFSLHPIIPEFEDGDNIHSIGEADMSFSDSAARGYGKQANMPRDIEMKCLVKWDAGGDGKAHFKNISLREIDPSLNFDDNPENPPPPDTPPEPTTVQGFFKFQNDVNTIRASACAGAGGGGGGGSGNTIFYSVATSSDKELSDSTTFAKRTRVGESADNSSGVIEGKIIKQVDVWLKKVGTPGASPLITAGIDDPAQNILYTSPTTLDPSTLTTSFVKYSFDFASNTHVMIPDDGVFVRYTGTSSTSYVVASYNVNSVNNCSNYYIENDPGMVFFTTRDWAADLWE